MSRQHLLYDFLRGHPNNNELPVDDLYSLFQSINSDSLRSALQYGQGLGNPELISELTSFIERQCATDVGNSCLQHARSLFITEGVSHGVDLLVVAASRPGDYVLTEHPTYFLISGIFRSHNLKTRAMPTRIEDGGIDFDALENSFLHGPLPIPRLIYIIPSHHNPTGRCMSNLDREALTKLAYKYKLLVIADEVYHLLDWGGQPRLPRMVTWNSAIENSDICPNNSSDTQSATEQQLLYGCVSVSSFTKIFGPGVRCGWIEASDHRIIEAVQNTGYIDSQGAVAPVMGSILAIGLANRTVDRVLQRLRDQYQMRCNLLCDILHRESLLQLACRPTGGYFVWIRFPRIMNHHSADLFMEYCLDHGVRFMSGSRCDARSALDDASIVDENEHSPHSYARLCFAYMNAENIEQGAEIFLKCFRSYMEVPFDQFQQTTFDNETSH